MFSWWFSTLKMSANLNYDCGLCPVDRALQKHVMAGKVGTFETIFYMNTVIINNIEYI